MALHYLQDTSFWDDKKFNKSFEFEPDYPVEKAKKPYGHKEYQRTSPTGKIVSIPAKGVKPEEEFTENAEIEATIGAAFSEDRGADIDDIIQRVQSQLGERGIAVDDADIRSYVQDARESLDMEKGVGIPWEYQHRQPGKGSGKLGGRFVASDSKLIDGFKQLHKEVLDAFKKEKDTTEAVNRMGLIYSELNKRGYNVDVEGDKLKIHKSIVGKSFSDLIEKAKKKPYGHKQYQRLTPKGKLVQVGAKGVKPTTINKEVMSHLLKEAQKNKAWAIKISKDKEWMENASEMSKQMVKERMEKPIEELARNSYDYLKMRAAAFQNNYPIAKDAMTKWLQLGGKAQELGEQANKFITQNLGTSQLPDTVSQRLSDITSSPVNDFNKSHVTAQQQARTNQLEKSLRQERLNKSKKQVKHTRMSSKGKPFQAGSGLKLPKQREPKGNVALGYQALMNEGMTREEVSALTPEEFGKRSVQAMLKQEKQRTQSPDAFSPYYEDVEKSKGKYGVGKKKMPIAVKRGGKVISQTRTVGTKLPTVTEKPQGDSKPTELADKNTYDKVYFRLDSNYKWGGERPGMPIEEEKAFDVEADKFLQDNGFELEERHNSAAAPSGTRGAETLYMHPMSLSGWLKPESIPQIETALKKDFKTFKLNRVDVVQHGKFNYTPEELKVALASKTGDIDAKLLEGFQTKRKNLYKLGGLNQVTSIAKNATQELNVREYSGSSSDTSVQFVLTRLADLINGGKIEKKETDRGTFYRTVTPQKGGHKMKKFLGRLFGENKK